MRGLSKVHHIIFPSKSLTDPAAKRCVFWKQEACCDVAVPLLPPLWGGHLAEAEALKVGTQSPLSLWIFLVSDWGLSLGSPLSSTPTSAIQLIVLIFLLSRIFLLPGLFWSDTQDSLLPLVLSCLFPCLVTPHPLTLAILLCPINPK